MNSEIAQAVSQRRSRPPNRLFSQPKCVEASDNVIKRFLRDSRHPVKPFFVSILRLRTCAPKMLTPIRMKLIRTLATMKFRALGILVSLAIAFGLLDAPETRAAGAPAKSAFVFDGVSYLHRWSMNDQHEFTPQGQEDLEKWSDMITINVYPNAHDGEALAAKANAVLENYKNHQARVLRTNSVPQTPDRPAEHFIAVVFGRPNFIEVAFARFKLVDGLGCSIVYSHRIYGEKIGDQMSAWLKTNGAEKEKTLMEWKDIPPPASIERELPRKGASPSDAKASPSKQ